MHIANSFFQVRVDCFRHEHNPQFYDKVDDEEEEVFVQNEIEQVRNKCVRYNGEELAIANCAFAMTFEKAAIGQEKERDCNARIMEGSTWRG